MSDRLFPAFIKLSGRLCVVVGAGNVAQTKIESLLACGARLLVVAPQAKSEIQERLVSAGAQWIQREFRPADLDGAFLTVAATSDPNVNRAVFLEARRLGVLCNSVDDPPHCDFYFPALVQRGDLQVAISTAGQSPAFAQLLRRELENLLDSGLGVWLKRIGRIRRRILARGAPSERRTQLLHRIANRNPFAAGDGNVGSNRGLESALSSPINRGVNS
jgi:precorrin-2 dehydrogenase / sirohydrochlorin ferrochelatase